MKYNSDLLTDKLNYSFAELPNYYINVSYELVFPKHRIYIRPPINRGATEYFKPVETGSDETCPSFSTFQGALHLYSRRF